MSGVLYWVIFAGTAGVILLVQSSMRAKERARRDAETKATNEQRAKQDKDDAEFWKSAKRFRATVRSAVQFGTVNQMPNMNVTLMVDGPDGRYEASVEQPVDVVDIHRLGPGSVIGVQMNPSNRARVKLDFYDDDSD